jgi:diguanylate cyclase (GGDEF)-like protein/putative nucleotidyltransferase with HDIG domain
MKELSPETRAYLLSVYAAGTGILAWQLTRMQIREPWLLLGLCCAASLAAIFTVEGATNRSHYTVSFLVYGFTFAALGISATLAVIAISCTIEWMWKRWPWFIQLFNMTCYVLVMYVAHLIFAAINPGEQMNSAIAVLALSLAMAAFTVLNHLLVGVIVWLARGESFQKSGVFDLLPLMIDMTLLSLGGSMVIVWNHNPYALALFSLPLYLIYSTLRVPSLERQTETDSKTGLFNHGYFMQQVENELRRASRFDRPLTIIMADLDLLRNINNTYGHLAGDEVLVAIAAIFKQAVREYDVVARFGGEEFAILMPETSAEQAFERGEKIRQTIEQTQFAISTSVTPISVTVSMGIAGRERFDQPAQEIIHNADTALYHSKLRGRNKTYVCANETYRSFLPDPVRDRDHFVAAGTARPASADVAEENVYPAAEAVLNRPEPAEAEAEDEREAAHDGSSESTDERKRALTTVNVFIACVLGAALLGWALVSGFSPWRLQAIPAPDWLSLGAFAILVVLTEMFSVELYVKNTTISTSAAPILAGTLIFGPLGALILSATFAVTALIKYRSPVSRLFFNFGNQLLAAMIYTGLLVLSGAAFAELGIVLQLIVALLASLIVYLVTTALVAEGISLDLRQAGFQLWKEQYGWMASSYVGMGFIAYALIFGYNNNHFLGVILMVVPLVLLRMSQKQYVDRTRTMVNELHEKQRRLERTTEEIKALSEGLLDTLAEVIDLGDPSVLGHSVRVAQHATGIARLLGLREKQIELIRNASLLHDIGKLGISPALLAKPARLTAEEYEIVKTHVRLGAELLGKTRSLQPLAPIIACHHEHFDGRGYPNSLPGKEIPLEARIIAAADAIETMASDRPYSKPMTTDRIVEELLRCSGSQFDPQVVEAAIRMLGVPHPSAAADNPKVVPALRVASRVRT